MGVCGCLGVWVWVCWVGVWVCLRIWVFVGICGCSWVSVCV